MGVKVAAQTHLEGRLQCSDSADCWARQEDNQAACHLRAW